MITTRTKTRAPVSKVGRPPEKREQIVKRLRRSIITGRLKPEQRLPSQRQIKEKFDASNLTVQEALNTLMREGFIEARGPKGTFVTRYPPHLSRFGVLFPSGRSEPTSFFYQLFADRLRAHLRSIPGATTAEYFGILSQPGSKTYRAAIDDLRHRRIAGLIFTFPPSALGDNPLNRSSPVPRVAVQAGPAPYQEYGIPACFPDLTCFIKRAVAHLASVGCRRIATLNLSGSLDTQDDFLAACRKHGLQTHPYWSQFVGHQRLTDVNHAAQLLMHPGQTCRPDGLIVTDDHLVLGATEGLRAVGVRGPQDLRIVGLCNYPGVPQHQLPVDWLGFDLDQLTQWCVEMLDRQREGDNCPPITWLPAELRDANAAGPVQPVPVSSS